MRSVTCVSIISYIVITKNADQQRGVVNATCGVVRGWQDTDASLEAEAHETTLAHKRPAWVEVELTTGTAITEAAYMEVSPFPLDENEGVISIVAFDGDHCVQMCCEQPECLVAVFVDSEATCYLKGAGGTRTESHQHAEGVTSYELLFREGASESMAMAPTECSGKKGLAFDFPDGSDLDALALGMSWWYNWSPGVLSVETTAAQALSGCEYIPMLWGTKDFTEERLASLDDLGQCSHLLGFNEPNFGAQASLTPTEAAKEWSTVKTKAELLGAEIVSPAVNFCGGDCNREDPIEWLDEFFVACDALEGGCGVTAIAVHSYTCQVKYLNKHIHSYLKYGLPIWLTEFACADDSTLANEKGQASYLADALLFLELHPHVARYAWFTGRGADDMGVGGADLLSGTGELTALGSVFAESYKDLQRCSSDVVSDSSRSTGPTPSPVAAVNASDVVAVPGNSQSGVVDRDASEITNVVLTNLGGTGTYQDVMSMADGEINCPDEEAACVKEELTVTGPLAPFDEGVSVVFRGPMNLHNIVWYQERNSSLAKASSWTPTSSDNLVFMNNLGGTEGCSGAFTFCGGFSQSYSDESGDGCSTEPTQFAGVVGGDEEVNIMTATECTADGTCGFYRNTGMEGWKGDGDGTKVMVFEADMPHCDTEGFGQCTYNRPAVWALNDKVLRTAQYGCNCRGMGGNGGCGEFDIVEAIIGSDYDDMMLTTVYDFKGTASPGTNKYFRRPSTPTHFAAIFRGGADAYLQVVQLTEFDYTQESLSELFLDSLKVAATEVHEVYDVSA
eukprot:jgi/Undpi1/3105/HiC_scaffold_15.g06479.m1